MAQSIQYVKMIDTSFNHEKEKKRDSAKYSQDSHPVKNQLLYILE